MSGPLPAPLAPFSVPASWLYRLAVAVRNARFDGGTGVVTIDRPVISVGNLTAGGTGKTPLVRWLASRLVERGRRPLIAMRGYRARPGEAGDEQAEYALLLPDVPVVAAPDRAAALRAYLARDGDVCCVLLDDGFQHRRVHRDLDVVLIDASRDTLGDRLLPRGWLREPAAALRRADAVVVTRAEAVDDELAEAVARFHGTPPLAWSRHAWTGLDVFGDADSAGARPVDWLAGRRVATMLGVANPEPIVERLRRAGAAVVARVPARDHEHYDGAKLRRARRSCAAADALVTTGKDWAKLRRLLAPARWPVPIVVPRLEIDVFEGAAALDARLEETLARGAPSVSVASPAL